MEMGAIIGKFRKEQGLTQEALAQKLGVTNQAVSKWEAGQNYPDVQLLPLLADTFGITIDQLFGRSTTEPEMKCCKLEGLPWENDNTLHGVLYVGHTLVKESNLNRYPQAETLTLAYEGPALNVSSVFSVSCGDVAGNIEAGSFVNCGSVQGNVDAGEGVACKGVGGDVSAGESVCCGDVTGSVDAGADVTCGSVGGDVDAGADVKCGNVSGNVDAGCDVTAAHIEGNVDAGVDVKCGKVNIDMDEDCDANAVHMETDTDGVITIHIKS